jgi:hypothetical protein
MQEEKQLSVWVKRTTHEDGGAVPVEVTSTNHVADLKKSTIIELDLSCKAINLELAHPSFPQLAINQTLLSDALENYNGEIIVATVRGKQPKQDQGLYLSLIDAE